MTGIDFGSIRENIRTTLAQRALPSLAVAVACDGQILWEEGFGWADRERRIPATPHTAYSVASITKPMTATALMILVERGLVNLDASVNDDLGDAPLRARAGNAEEATVRRVANHTSGLPLHYQLYYADEPYPRPAAEETIRRYGNLVTAPGERWRYSNMGYGVLGHVISRVSRQSYADFVRQEVFLPLGMLRASVRVPSELRPFAAAQYGSDGVPYPPYETDTPGASEAYASAHDLMRFGMFHLRAHPPGQRAILSDETIEGMQEPAIRIGGTRGYALGWRTNEDLYGYRAVGHTGDMGGVSASMWMIPSEKLVVAALANALTELPYSIVDDIFAALLSPYAERLAQEREAHGEPGTPRTDAISTPELLGEWRGVVHTYAGERDLELRVKSSGDVHARLNGQLWTLVNEPRFEDGWFSGEMMGDIGTPDASRRRHTLLLELRLRGDVLTGAIVARTEQPEEGGAPGKRVGAALSHWAELRRHSAT
jgi:CubicO group peptidase (beta-lactamase class C family)